MKEPRTSGSSLRVAASSPRTPEERLVPLSMLAREGGVEELSDREERAEKDRLFVALARGRALPKRRAPRMLLVAAAAAAAVIFLVMWPRDLRYSVHGSRANGPFVQAGADAPALVTFSDGSEIALSPGARARVADVSPRGARWLLESGSIHVAVQHRPKAEWSFEAGPFRVAVIGTDFDMAWSGDRLEVTLHRGAVLVSGGALGAGVHLGEGQRLVAESTGEFSVSAVEPSSSARSPAEPSAPPQVSSAPNGARLPPAALATPHSAWSARVQAGDFETVLAEADALGIDTVVRTAPLADLVALGDAARYKGRADVARRALIEQRARFPGTGAATSAAFLLGRMSEDTLGDVAGAIAYYDAYLREAPAGAFAEEALARKMLAVRRTSGNPAAAPIATEYLARYAGGPSAKIAREILETK